MLIIECPFCGSRDEREFDYGGLAKPPRGRIAEVASDREWLDYLLIAEEQGEIAEEYWWHVRGCGEWIKIRRNTLTHDIESPEGASRS
ncbi:MAG: sarcosine oxidase subunit delta [Rhodobacteraceae bacterium]|nr:sarcosine oxidase subunit delta [Paracoccaceae bacterium]